MAGSEVKMGRRFAQKERIGGQASLTCDLYPEGQKPGYCGYWGKILENGKLMP